MLRTLTLIFTIALPSACFGQLHPAQRWESAIRQFEQADEQKPPQENGVLFVGSSSIRMWDTKKWFPNDDVLNRGFGGSQISDVNYYAERIVLKYKPRVIVFYAGDNDIARKKSAEQVVEDFQSFLDLVGQQLPKTHVIFLPIKPSIKRWELWPEMKEANSMIQRLTSSRFNWHYADIVTPMLGEKGRPQADLFIEDGLHLNEKGYEAWTTVLKPLLAKADVSLMQQTAKGVVFHDANENRKFDDGEQPLAAIRVSNGRDIVTTDKQGRYELPVSDDTILFVVKPRDWRTPLSDEMLPEFYYIHKPHGSPKLKFSAVEPTGPLPDSVDFPLYPQDEPDKFRAILFGDTQPRDQKEIDWIAHDVIEDLIGTDASFGVTLGDIVFDDLNLFKPMARTVALLGIPWYNVIGNHDINFDAPGDHHSDETFESVFGPPYYSFDYGPVHFLVLDDVEWFIQESSGKGQYRGGLGERQMEFIRNDLALIPDEQLVVLLMHIPIVGVRDREDLYRLIEKRPFCLSISGHTHHHEHRFIQGKDGWRGPEPHHHIINVTVSGSWWSGAPDERGIPHTTMADGAPNGHSIITFDGQKYTLDFKAAGRPADYQMNIIAPEEIVVGEAADTDVYVNVFNGSERSAVKMRWGNEGQWTTMQRTVMVDPLFKKVVESERSIQERTWRDLPNPKPSTHLWRAKLTAPVAPGTHVLQVQTTDMHGRTFHAKRVIRVRSEK